MTEIKQIEDAYRHFGLEPSFVYLTEAAYYDEKFITGYSTLPPGEIYFLDTKNLKIG